MKISPSGKEKYDNCPHAYYLHYIEGIRQEHESATLNFGGIVHEVLAEYLEAKHINKSYDTEKMFSDKWMEVTETKIIEYTSENFTAEDAPKIGERLCGDFPQAWEDTKLKVVVDAKGPVLERHYEVQIDNGVIHHGYIDLMAKDEQGNVCVIDFKTPAQPTPDWFAKEAAQLKSYQLMIEQGKVRTIEKISKLGFFELIKRKVPVRAGASKGPEVLAPVMVNSHSEATLREHKQCILWVVDDIKRGRFPKRSRMAYNTPCQLCEFQAYCYDGNKDGLIFPEEKQLSII